jgi:hypothetical protein
MEFSLVFSYSLKSIFIMRAQILCTPRHVLHPFRDGAVDRIVWQAYTARWGSASSLSASAAYTRVFRYPYW